MKRMLMDAARICLSGLLPISLILFGHGAYAGSQEGRLVPWRAERDTLRFRTVASDNLMELLAIRPGMTILDIGAGTGQFALEFAARLKGTGAVYATDTNGYCVDYMEREARRKGLGNLHAVKVGMDGVDDFYRRHKYDLMTVFHISMTYEDRVAYFRELRGFLADGGRLVLILYKIPTPFAPEDFTGNLQELTEELMREPAGSPYGNLLRDSTRKRIRDMAGSGRPGDLRSLLAEDFTAMLSDTRFAARFSGKSEYRKALAFLPEEQGYAEWLLLPYRDGGALPRDVRIRNLSGARMFATINKLLIVQRYRKHLRKEGLFAPGFTPAVRSAFEKAGYKIEGAYADLIPFEDVVVFSSR